MLCCGGDVIDFRFADSRPTAKPNLQSNLTKTHNLVQCVKLKPVLQMHECKMSQVVESCTVMGMAGIPR